MSAPRRNPLWEAHLRRLHTLHVPEPPRAHGSPAARRLDEHEAKRAREAEWTAAPPGRLGRRLLADVEQYLEFFAIARGG